MKKTLFFLGLILAAMGHGLNAQTKLTIKRTIIKTVTIEDEGDTFDASSDDAEQENDGIDALYDDDLDAGWEGDPEDFNILTTGLRFQNVSIPKGATIDSAFIEVYSHEAKTADDVAEITIWGVNEDNTVTFDEENLITARPATSAEVAWTVNEAWGLWTKHRTPDLKAIVQEIVNRSGWNYENAMAFVLEGKDQGASEVENAREFESFENIADPEDGGDGANHPERVPRLKVYYKVGSSEPVTSAASVLASLEPSLSPNPANDEVNISLVSSDAASLAVYNGQGLLISQLQTQGNDSVHLAVSNYATGAYLITIVQNNKYYTLRFIKN
ncbi:MAG: T9SS type A sorting domain-containing protein [Cytophagales bacterium]|nr:T9SS type A sorting domain-containing protein [Cytophagales bacterium]